MARECQNQASKDHHQAAAKGFFMPGDAFAQLHNLSSHMACPARGVENQDKLEAEADWDNSNDEQEPQAAGDKPNVHNFAGSFLGPASGLTDTGAQQLVVGASAAEWWCERLRKRYGLVPVDVTPSNTVAWWNRAGPSVTSSEFSRWNPWCERSDALLGARRAHVA